MNVLVVTPAFPEPDQEVYIGIQRQAEGLVGGLHNSGINVRVATTFWGSSGLPQETTTSDGVPISRIPDLSRSLGKYGKVADLHSYSFGRSLENHFDLNRDIAVVHSLMELGAARRLRRKTVYVTTHHHWDKIRSPKALITAPFHRFLKRYDYRYADVLTVPSISSKQELESKLWGTTPPIHIIPHGIDTKSFRVEGQMINSDEKLCRILYVGPFAPRKRIGDLIEAIAILDQRNVDIQAVLVGTGQTYGKIRKKVDSYGLNHLVNLPGYLSDEDLVKEYQKSDVFVLPSVHEGFGQVILEAMATETPPIVTDIAPMNELVPTSDLIVEPRTSTAIANRIESLKAGEDLSELAGICRRHAVEKYEWKQIADQYKSLYQNYV